MYICIIHKKYFNTHFDSDHYHEIKILSLILNFKIKNKNYRKCGHYSSFVLEKNDIYVILLINAKDLESFFIYPINDMILDMMKNNLLYQLMII